MPPIEWSRLSSTTYERMVACLLSHQNPGVRRIDGSGGDGGRDCQFEAPDGLHALELKRFPGGRVGKTQRRQVVRSLKRAATLNPTDWTLITPIDPTPGEWEWFKKLRTTVAFPLGWQGLTWLDLEFSQRSFISDYYLGTTAKQVIDILRELNQEKGALANGVPDAIARVTAIVSRANQIDPHYRFRIASDGKTSSVEMHPAYPGAEADRPITIEAQFRFDTTTEEGRAREGDFRRAMDFGVPAELPGDFVPLIKVDAPAGLGGLFESPAISIGPGAPVTDQPLDLVFSINDPTGVSVATLQLRCVPQSSGQRGSVLIGTDRSGSITADVTIDVTDHTFHINLRATWDSFLPNDFAPVARFLNAYHEPNTVVIAQPDGSSAMDAFPCGQGPDMPDFVVEFARNLAMIQASVGLLREVNTFDGRDLANAAVGADLLRGAEVPVSAGKASVTVLGTASLEIRQQMASNMIQLERLVDAPLELCVAGTVYPLGHRYHQVAHLRVDPRDIGALVAEAFHENLRVGLVPDSLNPEVMVKLVD